MCSGPSQADGVPGLPAVPMEGQAGGQPPNGTAYSSCFLTACGAHCHTKYFNFYTVRFISLLLLVDLAA